MSFFSRTFSFFVIMLVLAACGNQQGEDLPTLAILPSSTLTDTPTVTPTPTATETLTNTPIATDTLTPTVTNTLTPTLTFTPTSTHTPTITLTFTQTMTPTNTETPTNTPTNTPTSTPPVPVINFFQSNVAQAAPGSQVTLRWSTSADAVELRQINQGTGTASQTFSVSQVGSQVVTLPSSGTLAQFRLVAMRGGQETASDLSITFTCAQTWFFSTAAPGGGCPTGQAVAVVGAYQPFERGIMFMYTNQSAVQRVCGMQNENSRYVCYDNGWDGSTKNSYGAPGSLSEPDDMFNWAWDSTLASGGKWETKIGWATASNADNNAVTVQYDDKNRLYVRLPSGTYFLDGDRASGVWTKIQ